MNRQKAVPTRVSTESRGIAGGRRPIALSGNDLGRVGDLGVALEIALRSAPVVPEARSRLGAGIGQGQTVTLVWRLRSR